MQSTQREEEAFDAKKFFRIPLFVVSAFVLIVVGSIGARIYSTQTVVSASKPSYLRSLAEVDLNYLFNKVGQSGNAAASAGNAASTVSSAVANTASTQEVAASSVVESDSPKPLFCAFNVEAGQNINADPGCVLIFDSARVPGEERASKALGVCAMESVGEVRITEQMLTDYGLVVDGKSYISQITPGLETHTTIYHGHNFDDTSFTFTEGKKAKEYAPLTGMKFHDHTLANGRVYSIVFESNTPLMSHTNCL